MPVRGEDRVEIRDVPVTNLTGHERYNTKRKHREIKRLENDCGNNNIIIATCKKKKCLLKITKRVN